MKKTIKGLLTTILAISLISCISVMAFATEETAHALDHEHTHEGVPTCQGHWCDICGDFYGEPNLDAHEFEDATCTTPKTCLECGEVHGEALGHDFVEVAAEEPAICGICGEPELAMVIFDPPAVTVWIEGFTRVILDFVQKFFLHLGEIFVATTSMAA